MLDEFERIRTNLAAADRAEICLLLGLNNGYVQQQHVPALNEFASEEVASEFRKCMLTGKSGSTTALLFPPAVCSRV
jgi:hypothetical protein